MVISAPVIYLLASDPRRMTAPLRSEGSAIRPLLSADSILGLTIGIRFNHSSLNLVLASRMTLVKLVNVYPGLWSAGDRRLTYEIQLTRIFWVAHSTARDLAMCLTAALEKLYGVWGWGTLTIWPLAVVTMSGLTAPDMLPIIVIDPPSGMSFAASNAQNQVPIYQQMLEMRSYPSR